MNLLKKISVSPKTIGSWEREDRTPPIDKLSLLADIFEVTTDYLLGKSNVKNDDYPEWVTDDDKRDLAKFLEYNDGTMMYQGQNLTEEEKEKLKIAMTQIFWDRHKHD